MRYMIGALMASSVAGLSQAVAPTGAGLAVATQPAACQRVAGRAGSIEWLRRLDRNWERLEKLPPGRLVGYVIDPAGAPLESVAVVLTRGSQPPGDTANRRVVITGRTGAFAFDSIMSEAYILHVRRAGLDAQWREYRGLMGLTDSLCVEMRATPYALGRN
jgi:hypothetical protein